MRMITGSFVALAVAGALTLTGAAAVTPAAAQGVYIQGPGFGVGVGRPAYRDRYYDRGYPRYYDRGYRDYRGGYGYSGRRYLRGPGRYGYGY